MVPNLPPESLDFLTSAPVPVIKQPVAVPDPADQLPEPVVRELMRIPGIDGVWIERDEKGHRIAVLYYTPSGSTAHLPREVQGLPTRIIGGEPIRAQ